MTPRRLVVLSLLAAYLGVGFCRDACAFDSSVARPVAAVAPMGHCRGDMAAPADRSRKSAPPCCALSAADAAALLPGAVALPAVSLSAVPAVAAHAPPIVPDSGASSRRETRAPPGAVATVRPQALHGPRPPPSFLA